MYPDGATYGAHRTGYRMVHNCARPVSFAVNRVLYWFNVTLTLARKRFLPEKSTCR